MSLVGGGHWAFLSDDAPCPASHNNQTTASPLLPGGVTNTCCISCRIVGFKSNSTFLVGPLNTITSSEAYLFGNHIVGILSELLLLKSSIIAPSEESLLEIVYFRWCVLLGCRLCWGSILLYIFDLRKLYQGFNEFFEIF